MAETTFTLWRQRLGYGIADLSCNLVWQMISLYLISFTPTSWVSRPIMSA
ncbi:Xyloside transporter XynT [Klebsiella pneumoniae]|uniref:Xyloside transporter XynT n=1 Tax=Klebsiella pneumoniae TaxID=573 RepID=A0A2X3I5D4_KLEPN|nr:Xyloside transporter XynT [Klebsiella pneumoniae]